MDLHYNIIHCRTVLDRLTVVNKIHFEMDPVAKEACRSVAGISKRANLSIK